MAEKVKDPVCGMEIEVQQAAGKTEYHGEDLLLLLAGLQGSLRKGSAEVRLVASLLLDQGNTGRSSHACG